MATMIAMEHGDGVEGGMWYLSRVGWHTPGPGSRLVKGVEGFYGPAVDVEVPRRVLEKE
jgi:hypothetical protein